MSYTSTLLEPVCYNGTRSYIFVSIHLISHIVLMMINKVASASRGSGGDVADAAAIHSAHSFAILNGVAPRKLETLLAYVLEQMAVNVSVEKKICREENICSFILQWCLVQASENYTSTDASHIQSMSGLEDRQVDLAIDIAKKIFRDAAIFGHIDRNLMLLRGVDDSVVDIVDKMWKKTGSLVADQIEALQVVETPSLVLQKTDWRLHLQMGSSKRAGQLQPTAIFQLHVVDNSSVMHQVRKSGGLDGDNTGLTYKCVD